jgi:hypothetical protein
MGRLVKPMVLRNKGPLHKNSPAAKSLIVADERDFAKERERRSGLIDKFAVGWAAGCTKNPHSFFGKMTPEEWAIIMYQHLPIICGSLGCERLKTGRFLEPPSSSPPERHHTIGA